MAALRQHPHRRRHRCRPAPRSLARPEHSWSCCCRNWIRERLISSRPIGLRCVPCSTTADGAFSRHSSRATPSLRRSRSCSTRSSASPLHEESTSITSGGASDVKDLSESRILIVDDVKTNVDILVEALRDEYKLGVALDGASALRSIEKNPADLVLLD